MGMIDQGTLQYVGQFFIYDQLPHYSWEGNIQRANLQPSQGGLFSISESDICSLDFSHIKNKKAFTLIIYTYIQYLLYYLTAIYISVIRNYQPYCNKIQGIKL